MGVMNELMLVKLSVSCIPNGVTLGFKSLKSEEIYSLSTVTQLFCGRYARRLRGGGLTA